MSVFARSDVAAVALSRDNGGCGEIHARPVVKGAPAKVFALACPMCEIALADDPLWSRHPDRIPLTPDEQRNSEKLAKDGTTTMQQVAEALAAATSRLLTEHSAAEIAEADKMARYSAAAEAERTAAAAERLRAEHDARLREAERVALASSVPAGTEPPHLGYQHVGLSDGTQYEVRPVVPDAVKAVQARGSGLDVTEPPVATETSASRACASCGGPLTRKLGAKGRWADNCLDCRKAVKAA